MVTTTEEGPNVRKRAAELGCAIPTTMAILPGNFAEVSLRSEFLQPSEAATVRSLFRSSGVPLDDLVSAEEKPSYIQNNGFEWIAPTIFVGSSLISENQTIISVALSVLANYVTDFSKAFLARKP